MLEIALFDYVVFGFVFLISLSIGVYHWFSQTFGLRDVFLGGSNMHYFPVCLSIMATYISAISLMGTSAEIYRNGTMYLFIFIAFIIGYTICAEVYMPIFYRLKLICIHEYLEIRFDKSVRYLVSMIYLLQMFVYSSLALYAPSLAFSKVFGVPLWATILSTGLICVIYTTMGGMRSVIWTDTFQMTTVFVVFLLVCILGTIRVGGLYEVFAFAWANGKANQSRLNNFLSFSINPLERHTLFSLVLGGSTMILSLYATNQTSQQRYLSCRTASDAKKAIHLNTVLNIFFTFLLGYSGLLSFRYFHACNVVSQKLVTRSDQTVILMMSKVLHELQCSICGLMGCFMACIFSAAVSSISSGCNSIAAVFIEDICFLFPCLTFDSPSSLVYVLPISGTNSNRHKISISLLAKIATFITGICIIGAAFVYQFLASTLLQIALSIFGIFGGPVFSIFTAGMFFPFINAKGTFIGGFFSFIATTILGIGSILQWGGSNPYNVKLCYSSSCTDNGINSTTWSLNTCNSTVADSTNALSYRSIFNLSYLFYTLFSFGVHLLIASLVSCFSNFSHDAKPREDLLCLGWVRFWGRRCQWISSQVSWFESES